jgi:hypothetical protein
MQKISEKLFRAFENWQDLCHSKLVPFLFSIIMNGCYYQDGFPKKWLKLSVLYNDYFSI